MLLGVFVDTLILEEFPDAVQDRLREVRVSLVKLPDTLNQTPGILKAEGGSELLGLQKIILGDIEVSLSSVLISSSNVRINIISVVDGLLGDWLLVYVGPC